METAVLSSVNNAPTYSFTEGVNYTGTRQLYKRILELLQEQGVDAADAIFIPYASTSEDRQQQQVYGVTLNEIDESIRLGVRTPDAYAHTIADRMRERGVSDARACLVVVSETTLKAHAEPMAMEGAYKFLPGSNLPGMTLSTVLLG